MVESPETFKTDPRIKQFISEKLMEVLHSNACTDMEDHTNDAADRYLHVDLRFDRTKLTVSGRYIMALSKSQPIVNIDGQEMEELRDRSLGVQLKTTKHPNTISYVSAELTKSLAKVLAVVYTDLDGNIEGYIIINFERFARLLNPAHAKKANHNNFWYTPHQILFDHYREVIIDYKIAGR